MAQHRRHEAQRHGCRRVVRLRADRTRQDVLEDLQRARVLRLPLHAAPLDARRRAGGGPDRRPAPGGAGRPIPAGLQSGTPTPRAEAATSQPGGIAQALPLSKFLEKVRERTAVKLGVVLLLAAAVVGLTIIGALRMPTGEPSS